MRIILRSIFCGLISSVFFIGCNNNGHVDENADVDPFTGTEFAYDKDLGQRIEAYHQTVLPKNEGKKEGNPSMYIDFSSGISQALLLPANKALVTTVYGSLSGGLDVFKLSRDSIIPFVVSDPTLIGKLVTDNNKYKDIYAPITRAVEQIVAKKNDAILITDFEEYYPKGAGRSEIVDVPYLKESFVNWLSKGNTIHFFISDYQEYGVSKHLFFTIFSYGTITNESIITRVENLVSRLARFDLSNKAFSLSQNYDAAKTGGIFYDPAGKSEEAKNILDLKRDKYINGLKKWNIGFELYAFGLDWETIGKLKEGYNKQNQFYDFFRKIFLDISNDDSYHIDALSLKVTDVTKDFEHFAKCQEVTKHKPHVGKGSKGEDKILDTENDRIALSCYDPSGIIKGKWNYSPQQVNELSDIFIFNKVLFDNTMTSSERKKAELAVSFDPQFDVKNIPSTARLLRIDIIVEKTTVPTLNPKMKNFSWNSTTKKGTYNTALAASIATTLSEPKIKPDQQVIYSYYIETLDN